MEKCLRNFPPLQHLYHGLWKGDLMWHGSRCDGKHKFLGSEDFPPRGVPYGAPAHNALSSAKINGGGILICKSLSLSCTKLTGHSVRLKNYQTPWLSESLAICAVFLFWLLGHNIFCQVSHIELQQLSCISCGFLAMCNTALHIEAWHF